MVAGRKEDFPTFGDMYDGAKMRQLVDSLTRIFTYNTRQRRKITVINTATYSMVADDEILIVDYTSTGACEIEMPDAALWQGLSFIVFDRGNNASVNNITMDGASAQTINGSATHVIATNRMCVRYTSDGSNWFIETIT